MVRVRVIASLEDDTNLIAKVTAHGPYAAADEVPDGTDDSAKPGEVSESVDLSELGAEGQALAADLAAVLAKVRVLAKDRLARRFDDAKYLTRQVALQRQEITR